jgi:DNA-binding CsgD family transcriptional regulator
MDGMKMDGMESATKDESGGALALASPGNASPQSSRFVFSKGGRETKREAQREARGTATDVAPWLLSVDLIGPPLLFQGIAAVIFGFDEVARVRVLTDRRTDWPAPPPSGSHQAPIKDHPFPLVRLFWHECLPSSPLRISGYHAALYGNSGDADMPRSSAISVAFSLYDTPDTLRAGLLAAMVGESFRSPRLPVAELDSSPGNASSPVLSERERQVIALAVQGWTNPAIADYLYLSQATVKMHLLRSFRKLGIERRTQLHSRLEEYGISIPHTPLTTVTQNSSLLPIFADDEFVEVWCETKDGSAYTLLFDGLSD